MSVLDTGTTLARNGKISNTEAKVELKKLSGESFNLRKIQQMKKK